MFFAKTRDPHTRQNAIAEGDLRMHFCTRNCEGTEPQVTGVYYPTKAKVLIL